MELYLEIELRKQGKTVYVEGVQKILPTNYCHKLKRISMADEYGVCGKVESSGHALWDCEVAEAVWRESKLSLPKFRRPLRDFINIVWKLWED